MNEKIRFPKRRIDGSFCVEVTFPVVTTNCEELLWRVKTWATEWIKANQVWTRKWEPGGQEEELYYDQEFKSGPQPISCILNELKIRLEGQPSAKWWRDWLVSRIIHDLKEAFTEIQSGGDVKNCEQR